MEPFQRRNSSLKSVIFRSLRISKKSTPKELIEEVVEEKNVFLIKPVPMENMVVHKAPPQDSESMAIFGAGRSKVIPCDLLQYFQGEGKPYDKDCILTSFERKRRAHHKFGTGHHAKEELFCPMQASQIELQFQSAATNDVVIRVIAPNGECSGLLRLAKTDYLEFSPSKVGCGHGAWTIDVAVRDGCRFKHVHSHAIDLNGQGIIKFQVDHENKLRQVDKLWLGFH